MLFLLVSLVLLSGCVRYDVGVEIKGQYQGQITQHIRLGEPLTNFSQREAQQWLQTLENRAKRLHGKTQRLGDAEIQVTIPFSNGKELRDRFNQFFNPTGQAGSDPEASTLVELTASLGFDQSNLLLIERDRLSLDVDLRSLGTLGDDQSLIINAQDVLNLEFALQTPWGASIPEQNQTPVQQRGQQLVWQLLPGQINHLEAVFWLPSTLGLGTVAIAGLVAGGATFKKYLNR
ncbi:MAG: DUF3153 domain-containing protein [Spirulina sp. SIO3F2]|nr:DUF3153 domain-containing protein [Spirulina sp. SIO3F2]